MKCEQYRNLIDDLIEGEANEQIAGAVNLHVFACGGCAFRYEAAKREREIYARYLFDAEPPPDLWAKFQSKLETENKIVSQIAEMPAVVSSGWKINLFGFRRLNPAFAGAVLIVVFGIGFALSKFMRVETADDNNSVAEINQVEIKTPTANSNRDEKDESTALFIKAESPKKIVTPQVIKTKVENKFADGNKNGEKPVKFVAVKTAINATQTISGDKKKDSPNVAELGEIETRNLELNTLESETARQIEKIELLLRSFRNARSNVESGRFDVAYEKGQARKLLEKNVRLRQGAESFGTFYNEEILGRVEPYLLDISNLENNPPPEKVREIKERVKNQNIIASLQSY